MRRFLYFFPGAQGMNPGMMKERGVLDRFLLRHGGSTLIENTVTAVADGPAAKGTAGGGGQTGCIVCAGPEAPRRVADEAWLQGATFWVGLEDDGGSGRPGPDDLAREIALGGYELKLCDGNLWRVPLIRRWNEQTLSHESNVPNVMAPTLVGGRYQYGKKVRPEFEAVDRLAEWIFNAFVAESTLPLEQIMAKAAALLAVNYRIGEEEVGLLGLLDEQTALEILRLAVDIRKIEAQAREMAVQGTELIEPVIAEET